MSANEVTGAEAGLTGDDQIRIALNEIVRRDGIAQMAEIYTAMEERLDGRVLSEQGRASLRRLINWNAVRAGFVYPFAPENPGWRITPEGREFLGGFPEQEEVVNVDTGESETAPAQTVASAAFEQAVLTLVKRMYQHYAWYHQGRHKKNERGLDLIGTPVGEEYADRPTIGVQVKLHATNNCPTDGEWLKFFAGCFVRSINQAIFVTTGRLSGNQRREAGEAKVIVIEGIQNLTDLCSSFGMDPAVFVSLVAQGDEDVVPSQHHNEPI